VFFAQDAVIVFFAQDAVINCCMPSDPVCFWPNASLRQSPLLGLGFGAVGVEGLGAVVTIVGPF